MRASLLGKRGSQTGLGRPAPAIAALVLLLAAVSSLGCGGSPTPPSPPPPSPSTLVGEWVLVTSDRPGAPSGIGVRRKVFTQTTWSITQRDPATGDVFFHHVGTYTLADRPTGKPSSSRIPVRPARSARRSRIKSPFRAIRTRNWTASGTKCGNAFEEHRLMRPDATINAIGAAASLESCR